MCMRRARAAKGLLLEADGTARTALLHLLRAFLVMVLLVLMGVLLLLLLLLQKLIPELLHLHLLQ